MLRAVKLSELSRNVFFHGVILAEVYRQKEEILFPFLNFLNRYRVSENRSPLLTAETWKTLYFFGPGKPRTLQERQEYYKFKSWIFDNPHYSSWLFKSTSMYAPREYMIPELKKLLIVTPRYFGAHFFPSYTPDLLSDFSSDKLSYLKFLIPLEGVEYLIAHCHGVPTSYICKWTGKTEVEIHQAVLDNPTPGFLHGLMDLVFGLKWAAHKLLALNRWRIQQLEHFIEYLVIGFVEQAGPQSGEIVTKKLHKTGETYR